MFAFEIGKIQIKLQSFFPISTRDLKHFEEMHFGSLCWQFFSESFRFPAHKQLSRKPNPFPYGKGLFVSKQNYFKFNLYFVI